MNAYSKMTNKELANAFNAYWTQCKVSRSNIGFYIRNHNCELYAEIEQRTIKLNQYKKTVKGNLRDVSIFERIYCLRHNLDDRPLCKKCNKRPVAGFMPFKDMYCEYCSGECQRHSEECIRKGLECKKKKYGEDNITNAKKAYATRMAKYGTFHPKDQISKVKKTKLERHGNENYVNVEKMQQTIAQCIAKNPNYYYDREQKAKQTKVANGHDPNWNNRKKFKETLDGFSDEKKQQIKDKRRQTCLDEYGVESVAKLDCVIEQRKQTSLERYGKTSFLATDECKQKAIMSKKEDAWEYFCSSHTKISPMFTKEEFVQCQSNERKMWKWKCDACGHEFLATWIGWPTRKCPKCFPKNFMGMQTEVEDFIKSICNEHDVQRNTRAILSNAKELDIYVKDLNIAIEFNGLFWHNSDLGAYQRKPLPMMYHYGKSVECQEKGIQLVHIFEDEWHYNTKLCKSKLKKLICPSSMMHIDGCKCEVMHNIDSIIKHKMLSKYAFFENDGSSIAYGLVHNNHLVAMLTLSKTRNNKQYEWQILNYVEVNSFIVDNGLKVLVDEFCKDYSPHSICMYASFDWATKDTYAEALDFKELLKPRLFWTTSDQRRIHDTSITKANVRDTLQKYDESKSFLQNMNDNKHYRIYDSGVLLFAKNFN